MTTAARERPSRSLIWALAESGGLSLISLAVLLIVAHRVGPAELGAFAIAIGIVQVLSLLVDMLVHDALIQRPRLSPRHLDTAFWTCAVLGIALCGLCWLAAPAAGALFDSAQVAAILPVAALSLAFSGFAAVPIAMLRRDQRFRPLALRSLVGRSCAAIAAVGLVATGAGIWALVVQHVAQVAISACLLWPATAWRPAARFSAGRLIELLSFGSLSVGTRLVWLGSARLFVLLVGNLLGVTAVGYINIAQRVVDTLFDLLAGAAQNLALPIFSRRQADRAHLVRAYAQATEFATLAAQPIFAGLAICAGPLIALLLGDTWLVAAPLVQVLALGALLQFMVLFGDPVIVSMGRPGVVFALSLLSFAFVIGGFFVAPPATPLDAMLIWVGRILLAAPILLAVLSALLELSPVHILRLTWLPLGATAIMAGVVFGVQGLWLGDRAPLVQLAVMVPLGIVVYGGAIALLGRHTLLRLVQFVWSGVRPVSLAGTPAAR